MIGGTLHAFFFFIIFNGTVVFGRGEPAETTLTTTRLSQNFVARYRADGALAWANLMFNLDTGDSGGFVTTLPDGSSVFAGDFTGTVTFGPGEPHQTTLDAAGDNDLVFSRLNPDGGF